LDTATADDEARDFEPGKNAEHQTILPVLTHRSGSLLIHYWDHLRENGVHLDGWPKALIEKFEAPPASIHNSEDDHEQRHHDDNWGQY
jgi:hypothetical protein